MPGTEVIKACIQGTPICVFTGFILPLGTMVKQGRWCPRKRTSTHLVTEETEFAKPESSMKRAKGSGLVRRPSQTKSNSCNTSTKAAVEAGSTTRWGGTPPSKNLHPSNLVIW
jgi:hypothetical protein